MFKEIIDTPWKLGNQFLLWFVYPWNRLLFALNGISWGKGWRCYGIPIIQKHRNSQMSFGSGLQLRSTVRSNPLGPNHPVVLCTWREGATLKVGDNFAMTGGNIVAAEMIMIGNNVNIGANTIVVDTDFHPLNIEERHMHPQDAKSAGVIIEDNVFIGMNCLILKGVTVGQGSVIGAGSVVTKNIPSNVVAAGNPARVIRNVS